MRMVRLQVGQEKVKDSVEEERLKLQQLADEVRRSAAVLGCKPEHRLLDYARDPIFISALRRPRWRWTGCSS